MPWVPFLPCLGIIGNFFLVSGLDGLTWTYFICYLIAGVLIYLLYGIHNSKLEASNVTRGQMEMSLMVSDSSMIG